MQFSESWLRSLCNPPLDSEQLAHTLTMAGLEVEEMHPVAPSFSHVVVARIVSCAKHPDADRLQVCQVDTGEHGVLTIVCGAPNAAPGLVVPCALVGAHLPGVEIKKAKVRGVESSGMLCSAKELGIADEASGLLVLPSNALVGTSIRDYLDLDDQLITLKLTPNRADCLSLTGIAREVAALTGAPLYLPENAKVTQTLDASREVRIEVPAACPRYCGRLIHGVNGTASTPNWMQRRLERCGIRPISVVVDITNYVMLELGQPLHAFDDSKLQGAIRVRMPSPGEQLHLLNGQTITPSADTVLIADQVAALAVGGIMGGDDSGVTETTRDVFLESAFFTPDAIAGKARALGFSSDASFRFERGVDFQLQHRALERASQLIIDICGGQAGPVVEAVDESHLPVCRPVRLRTTRASKVLGINFSADQVTRLLTGLGFEFQQEGNEFLVTPPPHRFDIVIEEDLIEELARLHGYDNIPAHPPKGLVAMMALPEDRRTPMQLRRLLAGRGYRETVNFSFVDAAWEADFCANQDPITLANPIASQMSVMRSSLIGSLVGALAVNLKRQQSRVRIFELGRCFTRNSHGTPVTGFHQPQKLAALAAGSALQEQWGAPSRPVDFFDLKADVESLYMGQLLRFEKTNHPALHPGRSAAIYLGERQVGILGEIHPRWVQKYELGTAPVVFELELDALLTQQLPAYAEVSRFPAVVRDFALIVDQHQSWQGLLDVLRKEADTLIKDIQLFDVYQGKGIAEGRKSLAFRVVMQDTQRTLEEQEVENSVAKLVAAAEARCGAELRR